MDRDAALNRHIPYRLRSVSALTLAWRWWCEWEEPKKLELFLDGELRVRGNSNAFINPVLESGFIHARALLEFLGLQSRDGRLSAVKGRRKDDFGIENLSTPDIALQRLSPEQAISYYGGDAKDAEKSLLAIFHLANKGFAHFTNTLKEGEWMKDHISIACEGIPVLVINSVYVPLGLEPPEYELVRSTH